MTIGTAAIVLPLLGAGAAAVALVHDRETVTPDRPNSAASAPAAPGGMRLGVPDAITGLGAQAPAATRPVSTQDPGTRTHTPDARTVPPESPGTGTDGLTGRTGTAGGGDATAAPSPIGTGATTRPSGGPTTSAPAATTTWATETREIPYRTRYVRDRSLPWGETSVRVQGENGIRTRRYKVTVVDGEQTSKRLVDSTVTREPVAEVVAFGTRTESPVPDCSPDIEGRVPVAEVVDCAGRAGDGPLRRQGPVRVPGTEADDRDRHHDDDVDRDP